MEVSRSFTADPPDIYRFYVYTISIGNGNEVDIENGRRDWDLLISNSTSGRKSWMHAVWISLWLAAVSKLYGLHLAVGSSNLYPVTFYYRIDIGFRY